MGIQPDGENARKFISWFLPMAALYQTLETKLLVNLHVGTPFNPSWYAKDLAPVWGSEIVNFTFWIATVLLSLGTTLVCFFILRYTRCTEGWNRLIFHGILIITLSGWFMFVFVIGLPTPLKVLAPGWTDPKSTTLIYPRRPDASKADAEWQYVLDVQVGLVLMAFGPLANKILPKESAPISWILCCYGWFSFILQKVRLAYGLTRGIGIVNP